MLIQLRVAPFPPNHALDIIYDRTGVFKRLLARLLTYSNNATSVKGDIRRGSLPLLLQALRIVEDLDCLLWGPNAYARVGRAEIDSDPRLVVGVHHSLIRFHRLHHDRVSL